MRIGDLAREVGTTPRTIRYYEELGLLSEPAGRPSGTHRAYTQSDLERLRELIRLKELLGVSLDELHQLVGADRQLELVRRRKVELEKLEADLASRRRRVRRRLGA
jgi:DNA-binding transcriptional MerR regulator